MGIIDRAKAAIERITSDNEGFAVELIFVAPTAETATINGLSTKTFLGVTTDGEMVNSKKAHVAFSEKFLTDADYPVRDANGEVDLKDHKVSVKDSTGIVKNYIMKQWFPDETIGFITCILNSHEQD